MKNSIKVPNGEFSKTLKAMILDKISVEDIKAEVEGELNELYLGGDIFALYGNGEVLVWIGEDETPWTFVIDTYGDRSFLVDFVLRPFFVHF